MTFILGVETSCDETAASIVKDGVTVVASSLATSAEIHKKTGGVIPEVAARRQLESIGPVISDCLDRFKNISSKMEPKDLDAIAVTVGPGLIGSLVVGVETAKALSLAWNKPIVPINHLVGHIYGNFIGKAPSEIKFPAVVLIVSGGHTDLVLMKDHGKLEYLGGTLDDAAGEAFDKVARLLGLASYMGGPAVSKAAESWSRGANNEKPTDILSRSRKPTNPPVDKSADKPMFKRPMIDSNNFDFSFSGIKTAVMYKVREHERLGENIPAEEIAYEFQEAVTDVLVYKTVKAVEKHKVRSIMLAGGVSANKVLREKFQGAFSGENTKLFIPPLDLCTDNASYIASCAYFNFHPKPLSEVKANPSLSVDS